MFRITDLYMPLKGFIYKNQHLSKLNNRNRSIWAFALNLENFTQHYANNFLYCIDSAGKKLISTIGLRRKLAWKQNYLLNILLFDFTGHRQSPEINVHNIHRQLHYIQHSFSSSHKNKLWIHNKRCLCDFNNKKQIIAGKLIYSHVIDYLCYWVKQWLVAFLLYHLKDLLQCF